MNLLLVCRVTRWCAIALLWFCAASASVAQPETTVTPSPTPLFVPRPYGPIPKPTQPPPAKPPDDSKPLAPAWYIAAGTLAFLCTALLLWGAIRAWRSSNLFDRQYRFPATKDAALRLGGTKTGGHMATTKLPPIKPGTRDP